MLEMEPLHRRSRRPAIWTVRTTILVELVALALTIGTVARALVGPSGALVAAAAVPVAALVAWGAVAGADHRRRRTGQRCAARS